MKLKDYIIQEGISQKRFAIRCKMSPAAICRLIKGERFPKPETITRIFTASKGEVTANDFHEEAQSKVNDRMSKV